MRMNQQNYIYIYIYIVGSITYMEEQDISVDLIALFHIFNGLATFFIFR